MKSSIEQLIRQLCIINRLNRESVPVPSAVLLEAVERECRIRGFSFPIGHKSAMRLLQRDIRIIDEMFYITIKHKRGHGYYIKQRDDDSPFDYHRFVADFDLLAAMSPDSDIHSYVLPEKNRYIGSKNFMPLLTAVKERQVVEFTYENIRKNSMKPHRVEPYFLKEDQMRWYLVSRGRNGDLLLFGIDRIHDLVITDERFERDPSIAGNALFDDCFGIWNDPQTPVENVLLRYDALDGSFLKSVPLHHSQKIIKDDDKEFVISLRIKITNDFVMALLSRTRSLEVLEPMHLRQRIRDLFDTALQRNQ